MSECAIPSQLLTTRKYLTFRRRWGAVIASFNSHLRSSLLTQVRWSLVSFFSLPSPTTTASTRVPFVSMSQGYTWTWWKREEKKEEGEEEAITHYIALRCVYAFLCYWQSNNISLLLCPSPSVFCAASVAGALSCLLLPAHNNKYH